MNTLKMWISLHSPELHRTISKTEAHIRFINSIWYATRLLKKVVWLVLALLVGLTTYWYLIAEGSQKPFSSIKGFLSWLNEAKQNDIVLLMGTCVAYLLICWYLNHSARQIMHYQRVRELNMILEAQMICDNQDRTQE